jgi:hypothetical protein
MKLQQSEKYLTHFKKNTLLSIFILGTCSLLQGCIPIFVGAAIMNEGKQKEAYTSYSNEVMKDNTQREIHGLKTNTPMTYAEWKKSLGITPKNEPMVGSSGAPRPAMPGMQN